MTYSFLQQIGSYAVAAWLPLCGLLLVLLYVASKPPRPRSRERKRLRKPRGTAREDRPVAAWHASATLYWGGYDGKLTFTPVDGEAGDEAWLSGGLPVIKVTPLADRAMYRGWQPVLRFWSVQTRASSGLEAYERLMDAEPLLRERVPELIDGPRTPRLLRYTGGALLDPCRHEQAIPVGSLLNEVVARLCPECGAQLPAG